MFQCSKQKIRYISTKSFGNSDLENLNLFGIWCFGFGVSARLGFQPILAAACVPKPPFISFGCI